MKWRLKVLGVGVAALVAVAAPSHAAVIVFDLSWSGAGFGNSASAVGEISLDDAFLPNPGSNFQSLEGSGVPNAFGPPTVTAFQITITGASSGNGAFTLNDFAEWFWDTGGATLDLSRELVGQPTAGDPWGTTGSSAAGDFNIFPPFVSPQGELMTLPPVGVNFFQLEPGGSSESMALTSFAPRVAVVPEPTSTVLFGLGAGAIAFGALRRRRSGQERKQ